MEISLCGRICGALESGMKYMGSCICWSCLTPSQAKIDDLSQELLVVKEESFCEEKKNEPNHSFLRERSETELVQLPLNEKSLKILEENPDLKKNTPELERLKDEQKLMELNQKNILQDKVNETSKEVFSNKKKDLTLGEIMLEELKKNRNQKPTKLISMKEFSEEIDELLFNMADEMRGIE